MYNVVGISLDSSKNTYYFLTNSLELVNGSKVIVETEQGTQYGVVVKSPEDMSEKDLVLPLKKVLRIATKNDISTYKKNVEDSKECLNYAKKCAKDMNLPMNFIDANYTFDRKQLFFLFVAGSRIDFRELAKKLAQKYRTRIELRQVGVRDKAKNVGGIGPCGLVLCCNKFLDDFTPVSINMAKNQFLALNPSKVNGVCGRLLCCLNYEDDSYTDLRKGMPHIGMEYRTEHGVGRVVDLNIFKRTFKVDLGQRGIVELSADTENK